MKEIMNWDICKKEHIKKVEQDEEKINSINELEFKHIIKLLKNLIKEN